MFKICQLLGLFKLAASGTHGLAHTLQRSSIGPRPLATSWKTLRVSAAAIGLDVLETLDVALDFSSQVSSDLQRLDDLANSIFFCRREVSGALGLCDMRLVEYSQSLAPADAIDRSQSERELFIIRYRNAGDTHMIIFCRGCFSLFLLTGDVQVVRQFLLSVKSLDNLLK